LALALLAQHGAVQARIEMKQVWGCVTTWAACASLWQWSLGLDMPYELEDQTIEKEFKKDDNRQNVAKLRRALQSKPLNATYGIVMLATEHWAGTARHSIPIWEEYCRKHGYDFVVQTEPLIESGSMNHEWSKLRLIIEVIGIAKWKYAWLVDPSSVVVELEMQWPLLIKKYLRHKQDHLEKPQNRLVWCPEECDEEYDREKGGYFEGACHGPQTNGCVFWVHKRNMGYLKKIYKKRFIWGTAIKGLKRAFNHLRDIDFDSVIFSDAQEVMGKPNTPLLANAGKIDHKHGRSRTQQMIDIIGRNEELAKIANAKGTFSYKTAIDGVHMPALPPPEKKKKKKADL